MAVSNLDKKLKKVISIEKSNWQVKAKWRAENQYWLKHSRTIAIKINKALREQKITQKKLAGLLNVSPQRANKIVKGQENLTLKTIAKIEKVLSIQLLNNQIIGEANSKDLQTVVVVVKQDLQYDNNMQTRDYTTFGQQRISFSETSLVSFC